MKHTTPETLALVPQAVALQYKVVPSHENMDALVLWSDGSLSAQQKTLLRAQLHCDFKLRIAETAVIERWLSFYYRCPPSSEPAQKTTLLDTPERPLIDLAITEGVSDIHIGRDIFFRKHGLFRKQELMPTPQLIRRLKYLAHCDVNDKYVPEDGHFFYIWGEQTFDIRLSKVESTHETSIVLRILNNQSLDLEKLGMPRDILLSLLALLSQTGLLLITGPTGSGKTTTACSLLAHLNRSDLKIVTAEDPIEYVIDGVCQSMVSPQASFAQLIRQFLRQDPDILFIGEIRDAETAESAFSAALTGHLVISTLHADNTDTCLLRLRELGVSQEVVQAALLAILNQKLIPIAGGVEPRFSLAFANEQFTK
ncbi:MAG: hypothetical protein A2Y14_05265 [Verrucomicrobia bacterium GWF2_51_19]|nr:MAG: hypothetical protein A2Y14_05265 [Verrucomicrobia bacterium GWF2_51_19]HCJ12340.1 hypothetical protein [Opitutae bacterium]